MTAQATPELSTSSVWLRLPGLTLRGEDGQQLEMNKITRYEPVLRGVGGRHPTVAQSHHQQRPWLVTKTYPWSSPFPLPKVCSEDTGQKIPQRAIFSKKVWMPKGKPQNMEVEGPRFTETQSSSSEEAVWTPMSPVLTVLTVRAGSRSQRGPQAQCGQRGRAVQGWRRALQSQHSRGRKGWSGSPGVVRGTDGPQAPTPETCGSNTQPNQRAPYWAERT